MSEDFRQQGVASKLLGSLVKDIDGLGGGIISGQVWSGNDASEKLFEKAEFTEHAKHFLRIV